MTPSLFSVDPVCDEIPDETLLAVTQAMTNDKELQLLLSMVQNG